LTSEKVPPAGRQVDYVTGKELQPRVRPLGPGLEAERPDLRGLPAELQQAYRWANGFELEGNVLLAAEDVGVDLLLPIDELEHEAHGVRFARGPFGSAYMARSDGAVEIEWGPDDADRGSDGRSLVARDVIALLSDLVVIEREPAFDGCPTIDAVLPGDPDSEPLPKPVSIRGPVGRPLEDLDGRLRNYAESLPRWLREVLEQRNGGLISGVYLTAALDDQEFTCLFTVGRNPEEGFPDASSLREALMQQGLDERWYPIGTTVTNDLVLTEAPSGGVAVHRSEEDFSDESLVVLPDGGEEFVAALRRATGLPG
jgi:hypothetical protein